MLLELNPLGRESHPNTVAFQVEATDHIVPRAKADVRYQSIAPPVYNDPELTNLLERCALSKFGPERVTRLDQPSLGAEDFAELLEGVPGTMFRLGVAGSEGCAPLHNGHFALDESSLEVGIDLLTETLITWMNEMSSVSCEEL